MKNNIYQLLVFFDIIIGEINRVILNGKIKECKYRVREY